jgi:hypothetical protein
VEGGRWKEREEEGGRWKEREEEGANGHLIINAGVEITSYPLTRGNPKVLSGNLML